jgi:hypothetical protein
VEFPNTGDDGSKESGIRASRERDQVHRAPDTVLKSGFMIAMDPREFSTGN